MSILLSLRPSSCAAAFPTQATILSSINSLSAHACHTLHNLGETGLVLLAYDNFDVDLKVSVPVVEKSTKTLRHLTSGLMFVLQHGVKPEDLQCSDYLWHISEHNPANVGKMMNKKTYQDLLECFCEPNDKDSHQNFNIWMFLRDLAENIEGFDYLLGGIGDAEVIEQIPVVKTDIYPAYAMDVNNSTVSGNTQAIEQLLKQAGLGGPDNDDCVDITDSVVLIHGDLGMGERISSIRKWRSIEDQPWEHYQYTKYCPGLFHLKMAAVETLWCIFLKTKLAQQDETCLMKDIGVLCPKETGRMASKFEFQRTHQVVKHARLARWLDCWHVGMKKRYPQFATLEDFAKSKPKLDAMKAFAKELVDEHIADHSLSWKRMEPAEDCDEQFENASIMMKYLMLYEKTHLCCELWQYWPSRTMSLAMDSSFQSNWKT